MDPVDAATSEREWRAAARERVTHRLSATGELVAGANVEIKPSARHGRGVFSTRAFAEGECVLIEEPLVAAQHEGNRRHARACAGCFRFVGDVSTSIGERLLWKYGIVDEDARASTSTPLPSGLTVGDLVRLANGEARLPGTEAFDGPRAVACPGGCDRNVYCSDACAETSWRAHESMMCLGPRGASRDKEALREFYAHASETNDIFILAAKAVAAMCCRANAKRNDVERLSASSSKGKAACDDASEDAIEDCARAPFASVANALWWESVATPDECVDESDERAFRRTLRQLASDSLELLRAAWREEADARPRFFSLDTYGRLIGAFELNNLELVVESPTENYFLAVDDAPEGDEKSEVKRVTQPLLDALDIDYDIPCLGTALFSIQSGFNHDCDPNAQPYKGERDVTGACVIVARKNIAAGEEITMSYLDDNSKSLAERNESLRDYGFACACARCEGERAAVFSCGRI